MAGRISCSLNLPFQDSNSALSKTTSQISWRRTEPHKNGCSLALSVAATVMVGTFQIIDVAPVEAAVVESPAPARRWSEKRTCPAWLGNSLETIVPENLPRPSSHRRLELAGLHKLDAPPPLGAVVTRVNKATCFSL